jgi:glycosyltransferase involved in cell wall biosynthesis
MPNNNIKLAEIPSDEFPVTTRPHANGRRLRIDPPHVARPAISLLVSSYNKPDHLRKCLASIALQQGLDAPPEVVVTDDGSDEETLRVVEDFAAESGFPTVLTTHPHDGFQLARCRNDGVRASSAPYLLFLDGDCVLPVDHVAWHLRFRKPGIAVAGDCIRLARETSELVTLDTIQAGEFQSWGSADEHRRLLRRHRSTILYRWIPHPRKPTLIGNNIGLWRADYERVNGFDEEFRGWGCEDDDFSRRLRSAGVGIRSILQHTRTFHLWHPVDVTAPKQWKEGMNVAKLMQARPTYCARGLFETAADESLSTVAIRVAHGDSLRNATNASPHFNPSAPPGAIAGRISVFRSDTVVRELSRRAA